MKGYYLTVDGQPLCKLPFVAYHERLRKAGDPSCSCSNLPQALDAVKALSEQLPGRVGLAVGTCPEWLNRYKEKA